MMKMKLPKTKPRNSIAKDLLSPKYRMRVAVSKKQYDRNAEKAVLRKESYGR